MGFNDWDQGAQSIFNALPGTGEGSDAETLFEYGWMRSDVTPEMRQAIRDHFYDVMHMPEFMFPWDEWREWMGYE